MPIARSARIYFTLTKENDVVNGLRCQSLGLQEYNSPLLRRTMSSMGYDVNRSVCKNIIHPYLGERCRQWLTMSIARPARIYFTLTKENDVVNGLRCQSPGRQEYISPLLRRTMSSMGYDVNHPACKNTFRPH